MAPSLPSAAPATDTPECVIESLEQLDGAMRELAQLDGMEATCKAELDKQIKTLNEAHAARLVTDIGGKAVKFADRRSILSDAIERYATAHRAELLPAKKKSRELNHGEIGWKKSRDMVIPIAAPATTEAVPKPKSILDTWVEKLLEQLHWVLGEWEPLKGLTAYVRIKVETDEAGLITAYRDRKVSDAQMTALGYRFETGEEKFWCKPAAPKAASLETLS